MSDYFFLHVRSYDLCNVMAMYGNEGCIPPPDILVWSVNCCDFESSLIYVAFVSINLSISCALVNVMHIELVPGRGSYSSLFIRAFPHLTSPLSKI